MLSKLMDNHLTIEINKMRTANFIERQSEMELKKVRRAEDNYKWKMVSQCPLCGCNRFRVEFEKYGSPLVMCEQCEVRYHQRIPADLKDVYQSENYELYSVEDDKEHFNYRKERFGRERVRLLEDICGHLEDKKLLDVGCGNGFFLVAAQEKCKTCYGSEFSALNREKSRRNTGLPIYPDPLDKFPEKDFDIITAFDVIEHIENPLQFMKDAKKLLKEGGYLMLFTPNFDSFSIRVMKSYSSIVDPTEHLILFNHNSLKKLGDIIGLQIVYIATRGLDINSILSYQSFLGEEPNTFLAKWINELQAMIDASGSADYLRVVYQKS